MRYAVVAVLAVLVLGAESCPEPPPPPPADPCAVPDADGRERYADGICDTDCQKPDPDCCVIGDATADAIITPIFKNVDADGNPNGFADMPDGAEVPLIIPPQGGKVILVGIRATNISCNLKLKAGIIDDCQDPSRVVALEARPISLTAAGDDAGAPVRPDELSNYANVPVCPSASIASSRDGDNQPYRLDMRITETTRAGESAPRSHVVDVEITPYCAQPDVLDQCQCECDADFISGAPSDQCDTINDNDPPPQECAPPVGEGEGEGEGE
ncbi:MAG TPA: hypothetical protein VGO62_04295 [Myxococcota bacterium]